MPKNDQKKRKWKLYYFEPKNQRPRWRKRYKGKEYYFVREDGETKEQSHHRCLRLWEAKKREIDGNKDHAAAWLALAARKANQLKAIEAENSEATWSQWEEINRWRLTYLQLAEQGDPCGIIENGGSVEGIESDPDAHIIAGLDPDELPRVKPPWERGKTLAPVREDSLKANVAEFLARKLGEHKKGKLSAMRYGSLQRALAEALSILGDDASIRDLNGNWLERVRDELSIRLDEGQIKSSYTARDWLQGFKQFVRWVLERDESLVIPRNLDSAAMTIMAEANAPEAFSDVELRRLFGADPSPRTRLYLLLMLNCGFQQTDIAELKKSEFDATQGTITRRRSKTAKRASSTNNKAKPQLVTWKLWPQTLQLLKDQRDTNDGELLLLNENGKPLRVSRVLDGRVRVDDNIKTAWRRLKQKIKGEPINKSLKHFRKTGATWLGSNDKFARYAQYFLAQKPNSVADTHYIEPNQEQFDAAVMWIGEKFDAIINPKAEQQ